MPFTINGIVTSLDAVPKEIDYITEIRHFILKHLRVRMDARATNTCMIDLSATEISTVFYSVLAPIVDQLQAVFNLPNNYRLDLYWKGMRHGQMFEATDSINRDIAMFSDYYTYQAAPEDVPRRYHVRVVQIAPLGLGNGAERTQFINDCFDFIDQKVKTKLIEKARNTTFETVLQNIPNFIAKRCRVYTDAVHQQVLIFIDKVCSGTFLRLASVLPVMMGWEKYYQEAGIDLEMFTALGTFDKPVWEQHLVKWYTDTARKRWEIKRTKEITEFIKLNEERRKAQFNNEIARIEASIVEYENELRARFLRLKELRLKQCGILAQNGNPFEELGNYILKAKPEVLRLYSELNGQMIGFEVLVPLNNFNVEGFTHMIHTTIKNKFNTYEDLKALLIDVFEKQNYTIIVHDSFRWDLANNKIIGKGPLELPQQGIRNPHVWELGCWGNNASYIHKAIAEENFILALEQSIAALQNLWELDGPITRPFFRGIRNGSDVYGAAANALINNETGEKMTLSEYLSRWHKAHNE
jgi:hypothetical protein